VSIIEYRGVTKKYGDLYALNAVNINIRRGEFCFLVGKSGAGKTTLIKTLTGEGIIPDEGEIYVEGVPIHRMKRSQIPYYRRTLGIIYQDYTEAVLKSYNAIGNVSFSLRAIDLHKKEIKERTMGALELVSLTDKAYRRPGELSAGEQQRLAIARAIAKEPDILICDEPTGNLDPDHINEVMSVIIGLWEKGTTVLFATHSEKIVNKLQQRVIVLEKGRVTSDGRGGYKLRG